MSEHLSAYELVGADDLTEPLHVLPCGHCESWRVEIYRRVDGCMAVREWHAERCEHLLALVQDDEADERAAGLDDMAKHA